MTKREPPTLRGAIDSLEGDWAVLVLDDGQRLDWPRERLPSGAGEGAVVVLSLEEASDVGAQAAAGTGEGVVCKAVQAQAQSEQLPVQLGKQCLNWPAAVWIAVGDAVAVRMNVDTADTDQRRRQVQDLVNDLFG